MASPTPPPPSEATSYTKMSVGDVEAIGTHCQMPFCHQLDFLPFRCESCKGMFCLDHRTETSHQCPKAGAWARARSGIDTSASRLPPKPTILNHESQCARPDCKTLIDTSLVQGSHCSTCNRRYCLKHRMPEDHSCKELTPIGARPTSTFQQQREKGLAALEKLKSWSLNKKQGESSNSSTSILTRKSTKDSMDSNSSSKFSLRPKPKAAAVQAAEINKLKTSAKGDVKIPADQRIYLWVVAHEQSVDKKHPLYFKKAANVGQFLDIAAKAIHLQNVNNRADEGERLRVLHKESGRMREFSEKLESFAKTGDTLFLVRGLGKVDDLIQLD